MVLKQRIIPLVFLLTLSSLALVSCQSTCNQTNFVSVVVSVNSESLSLPVPECFVKFVTQLARVIIRVSPGNSTFDIDECQTPLIHNCTDNEQCINLGEDQGFFSCVCNDSFIRHNGICVDDICRSMNITCNETGTQCNNNVTDLKCVCAPDYTDHNGACRLITPCFPNQCPSHSTCEEVNDTTFNCTCNGNGGYEKTGGADNETLICSDVNECERDPFPCNNATENCMNTDGSYTCRCKTGYTGSSGNCTDIDECATGAHNCDANAMCMNTMGSFTCMCNDGYTGNGTTCQDVDECKNTACISTAHCNNTVGSYTCTCNSGFTGDGRNCNDIDECSLNGTCHMYADCTNTVGSHLCLCRNGFTGNGVTCADIDECATGGHNCSNACENTVGVFECYLIIANINITVSTRKKRNTGNDLTASINELEARYKSLLQSDSVSITVEEVPGIRSYRLLIAAPSQFLLAVQTTLPMQIRQVLGSTSQFTLTYPTTFSYMGVIKSAEDECPAIINHIRNTGDISDSVRVTCNGTSVNGNFTFNVTVDGATYGIFDIEEIMRNYNKTVARIGCTNDLCNENATCSIINGARSCVCDDAHHDNNLTQPGVDCRNPIASVSCGSRDILVRLYLSYFYRIGLDPTSIHLLNHQCKGSIQENALVFNTNSTTCNWTASHSADGINIVYANEVTNLRNGLQISPKSISFAVTCRYSKDFSTNDNDESTTIDFGQMTNTIIVQSATGTGNLAVTLAIYTDSSFSTMLTNKTEVSVGQMLYVLATHSATVQPNILSIRTCWLTPTRDSTTRSHVVLDNGCPTSIRIATVVDNGQNQNASITLTAAKFTDDNQIYLHCQVRLCNSTCTDTCSGGSGRRRRRSTEEDNTITIGPVMVNGENTAAGAAAAAGSATSSAGVIGAVCGIIAVAAVGVFVIWRRKRNDLYFSKTNQNDTPSVYYNTGYASQTFEDCPARITRRN